jgi:hypothetical protein
MRKSQVTRSSSIRWRAHTIQAVLLFLPRAERILEYPEDEMKIGQPSRH